MSGTVSNPDQATGQRGPERFAAEPEAPEHRSPLKVVGAGLALVALLVGVPVALWLWQGPPPIPTGLPNRDDLTAPLGIEAILTVLTAVVWLAWAQFAICTVIELVSVVRGGGLPRPVPLSGRSQALARALIGTILIGGAVLGSSGAAQAVPTTIHDGSSSSATQAGTHGSATPGVAVAQDGTSRAQGGAEGSTNTTIREGRNHHAGVPAEMRDTIGKKVVLVQPPTGHYHDNLWDIAERHLGDGRRWQEIFDLNKGRVQPDGQQLILGRLIQPGWVLIMPDNATGLDRVTQHQATPKADAPTTVTPPATDAVANADQAGQQEGRLIDGLARDLLGGGLFAAGLSLALIAERRRRRGNAPTDPELDAEVALLVGADEDRATWLDQSLRGLSALCRAEDIPLPPVYAVTVTDEVIELRLAPESTVAPAPWTPVEEGRRWRLTKDAPAPVDRGHAPYPGLVCLGRDSAGADVLIDLESVGGAVSITGADAIANEVVSALAVQLVTAPWADDQVVHAYHLSPVLDDLGGDRFRPIHDLEPLVGAFEASKPRRGGVDVLTGRLGRRPGLVPAYAVLGSVPDDDMVDRLNHLTRTGARGFGVVSVGRLLGTRWQLSVDETGHLVVPLLGLEVDAVRLTAQSAELVAGLFAKARTEAERPDSDQVSVPAPPRSGDDAHWSSAAVRVGVLGSLESRAPGVLDPARLALATEVATYLALQPAPVHPSVLGASIWPRGVTPEVRDATIARVREWLGKDADGTHLVRENDEGRLYLANDVAVDWHAFCTLVQKARTATGREESELLRRALQLVRGPLLIGRPRDRYSWLVRTRLETVTSDVVVDAAHRLAMICGNDDPTGGAAAARAGLRLAPDAQVLWRDLLRAEADGPDGGPAVAEAAELMISTLESLGIPLEAETEALVEELIPHSDGEHGAANLA